jgi:hypothetical protein
MRKALVLALVLLVALAGIGVAYAGWTHTLTVNGTVATGYLEAHFAGTSATVSGGTGSVVFTPSNPDWLGFSQTLGFKLSNAEPGTVATIHFDVKNDGTVPASLNGLTFGTIPSALSVTDYDCNKSGLAVGETYTCVLKTIVTDSAAEYSTYDFSATILVSQ